MRMNKIDNNNKTKNNKNIVLVIGLVFIITSIILLFFMFQKYIVGSMNVNRWNNLYQDSVVVSLDNNISTTIQNQDTVDNSANDIPSSNNSIVSQDFDALLSVNNDVVGYVIIPDTKLSLPVTQGQDNDFYLDRTLEKKKNPFGVPFLDYRATLSPVGVSNNLSIYGHAANDGSYFSTVKSYKKLDYYKKHPIIKYNSIYKNGDYKIIGAFMEDTNLNNPNSFFFHQYVNMNEAEFNYYIDEMNKRSYFTTDVDVAFGDELITLSTCDTDVDNSLDTPYRMALIARRVRDGETIEVNVQNATINKDMIMPKGWVEKFGKQNPYK